MLGRIFKAYDIRGTYPDLLNDTMAWQIGHGAAKFLLASAQAAGETTPMMRNIVVGRDMRASSPVLARQLMQGINDQGADVIDLGLVDTSMIYFAVNHLDCAGGIMVTASHNPPNYNGFKICARKAKPIGEATGLADIRKNAAMVDKATVSKAGGRHEPRDLWPDYARHVRSFLDTGGRKLKVVIDASNGMAGTMIPRVFGKASALPPVPGLTLFELNFDNTKNVFAHEPNPLVLANLRQTQELVLREKADVGFCYDGDADRCMVVDEKGRPVGCDLLTALLAKRFLATAPGSPVCFDLRSTKAVAEDVRKAGGVPVRCRVGHVFMKQAMAEQGACFGGELSGHFYFRDNFNADSGAIAMCSVLSILAKASKPMSQLIGPIARYQQSGEINFQIDDKDAALARIKQDFGPDSPFQGEVDELDGVTIDCFARSGSKGGWWCNVRKSNTEPLLRLNLETKDRKAMDKMLAALAPSLGKRVDH